MHNQLHPPGNNQQLQLMKTYLRPLVLCVSILILGVGAWRLFASPLGDAAAQAADAFERRDGGRLYDLMSERERKALGVSRQDWIHVYSSVVLPVMGNVKRSAAPDIIFAEQKNTSASAVSVYMLPKDETSFVAKSYATETGVEVALSRDVLEFAWRTKVLLEHPGIPIDHQFMGKVAQHAELDIPYMEQLGMKGYYDPRTRQIVLWSDYSHRLRSLAEPQ